MATDLRRKEELSELTSRIVDTFSQIGIIHHLAHCALPSYEAVIEIAQDLKEVIFPGYRRRQNLHFGNVLYHIGDLIDGLHDKLTQQIARAMRHDWTRQNDIQPGQCAEQDVDFEALGQAKAIQFLESLPRLRQLLALD
ncbi:MAG: serine acetyltransferase, partial [Planctomycetales bacterium]